MAYGKQSLFERFHAWWWPSLLAWLPGDIARSNGDPERLRFFHFDGAALREATSGIENRMEAIVVLSRRMALVRHLRMPASSMPHLRNALRAEIERQTPFDPEAVFFDAITIPPVKDGPFFEIVLAVAQKHLVEAAMHAASGLPIHVVAVDVAGTDDVPLGANLLPGHLRRVSRARWQRWNVALILICLLASFGISTSLLHARQQAVADLETRFQPLREQAMETLRRQRMLTEVDALLSRGMRNERTSALELLNEISKRLPADSHLLQLRLAENAISIRGQTANLGAALTELGRSPLWEVPRLTGSRTLPDGRSQEFSLVLTLKQAPAGAAR